MRKIVLILVASIAVITFIRAFDYSNGINSDGNYNDSINADGMYTDSMNTDGIYTDELHTGENVSFVVE